jgi:hypothetical protein
MWRYVNHPAEVFGVIVVAAGIRRALFHSTFPVLMEYGEIVNNEEHKGDFGLEYLLYRFILIILNIYKIRILLVQ